MHDSIVIISVIGFLLGIVGSMPIVGPVGILISSHALRGHLGFCLTAAIGASIIDFAACFLAVHGFSRFYPLFAKLIPYILLVGSAVLFFVGIRIIRAAKKSFGTNAGIGDQNALRLKKRSGFWSGFIVNASNPPVFIGWLTSSLIVLSFAASLGLDVGGLDRQMAENVTLLREHTGVKHDVKSGAVDSSAAPEQPHRYRFVVSFCFAFFVALGTNVWYFFLARFLSRNQKKIRVDILGKIIRVLGLLLCCTAVYMLVQAIVKLL
ncbi:MAG: LysE family transporter [Chitinispirillaceae bacterium]|nr:LysE family transporter [Chitinispirillaceae bacterium]